MPDARTSFTTVIPEKIRASPERARAVGGVVLFKISGERGGVWTVNLKDDLGVAEGDQGRADCTIELPNEVWESMTADPRGAMNFYFSGRVRVLGNAVLASKLQGILG
ncbi:MAG: SCP2 sterol-binding domain-containing protein [Myxococcales bacterium]|nr:SCP2 sterol-binding domain-containing protein [Myxococcales bacterium]